MTPEPRPISRPCTASLPPIRRRRLRSSSPTSRRLVMPMKMALLLQLRLHGLQSGVLVRVPKHNPEHPDSQLAMPQHGRLDLVRDAWLHEAHVSDFVREQTPEWGVLGGMGVDEVDLPALRERVSVEAVDGFVLQVFGAEFDREDVETEKRAGTFLRGQRGKGASVKPVDEEFEGVRIVCGEVECARLLRRGVIARVNIKGTFQMLGSLT